MRWTLRRYFNPALQTRIIYMANRTDFYFNKTLEFLPAQLWMHYVANCLEPIELPKDLSSVFCYQKRASTLFAWSQIPRPQKGEFPPVKCEIRCFVTEEKLILFVAEWTKCFAQQSQFEKEKKSAVKHCSGTYRAVELGFSCSTLQCYSNALWDKHKHSNQKFNIFKTTILKFFTQRMMNNIFFYINV